MTHIRIWIATIYVGLVTVAYFFAMLLARLWPREKRWRAVSFWGRQFQWGVERIGGLSYRCIGAENCPTDTAYVVMAKHQSIWETITFHCLFFPLTYVVKKQLLYLPFFGWGLWLSDMIAIDRDKGMESMKKVLTEGEKRLRLGFNVVIYPEGTRVAPGERLTYHKSGALLACRAGVPVIPVAHNAGEFWPKNRIIQKPGAVTVSIGPAIDTRGKTAAQVTREVEDWIETEMLKITALTSKNHSDSV